MEYELSVVTGDYPDMSLAPRELPVRAGLSCVTASE
jgi:hypothetical protein